MVNRGREQRWFLYAMGGGFGHLCRTVSLARAVRRHAAANNLPIHLEIVTNSPYANAALVRGEIGQQTVIHVVDGKLPKRDICSQVRAHFVSCRPDVLVMDAFPRGLGGEFADVIRDSGAFRVLTHRDLNPAYVTNHGLRAFVRRHFDLVLAPGENGPLADELPTVRTGPWLIRDANELASFGQARRRMQASLDRPLVAVIRSGKPQESEFFEEVAARLASRFGDRLHVRLICPPGSPPAAFEPAQFVWPFFPWVRAANIVVGAGGYNTVHETRSAGVTLIAAPQERLYDRQRRRLRKHETADNLEDIVDRIEDDLASLGERRDAPEYKNGAAAAAECIFSRSTPASNDLLGGALR